MQTLEGIRKSIDTAGELRSVVKTMKGIAAASIRQFERAVGSLGEYTRTVELGLQVLLRDRALPSSPAREDDPGPLGAVVFGSDQGMCGRFNSQLADYAVERLAGEDPERLAVLAVGGRIRPLLETADLPVAEPVAPASSPAGIHSLVQELLLRVQDWRAAGRAERVVLFYNESRGGASYGPTHRRLIPMDPEWLAELAGRDWPGPSLPIRTLDWEELFRAMVREYLYSWLFRASAESLASENASRLASMQAAERNIDERLELLQMRFRQRRQQEITEELLDIISGFEALQTPRAPAPGGPGEVR